MKNKGLHVALHLSLLMVAVVILFVASGCEPGDAPQQDLTVFDLDDDGVPNSEDPDLDGDGLPNDQAWCSPIAPLTKPMDLRPDCCIANILRSFAWTIAIPKSGKVAHSVVVTMI